MQRSKFSLSNTKLLTCNMGELVPIGLEEVLPGDTIQQATSLLLRVSPLVAPVMHPVIVRVHHWFVPFRLLWENWENFITGGPDGMDASVFPTMTEAGGPPVGSLLDYLGVPTLVASQEFSALPNRAYVKIFNDHYRDEDLVAEAALSVADGNDVTTDRALKRCAWEKDYFTSARPWAQKGPEVTLPLGTEAPVISNEEYPQVTLPGTPQANVNLRANAASFIGGNPSFSGTEDVIWGDESGLIADLANATAVDVNTLRRALAIQRYEEARARYGSRYVEYLRYLGVRSSDARLQRPEYLGGGKQTIQFSEVLQTAPTTSGDDAGVADLKGHGIAGLRSNRWRRFFEEHGYVVTLLSVRPKTIYAEGLSRTWNRRTKEDFFQKELEHIGQQEVLNKEIYSAHAQPLGTFGYQDRYDEYRRRESSIAGEFRTTLNYWHMARLFGASTPALNGAFVTANPTDRIYASTSTDQLIIMANHSVQARRIVSATGSSFIY